MWLDELNDLVVELNTKIDQHREILQKSESSTRYCLIDPLLTALGWDLSDPAQVLTEYKTGNGRADYAMVPGGGPPSLVVEAKSLLTPTESAIEQTLSYCQHEGIKYFAVTNGDEWEVYETHRPVPMQDKRVTVFKITGIRQNAVMRMLWLWRGNFKDGDPVRPVTHSSEDETGTSGQEGETKTEVKKPSGNSLSELTDVTGKAPPQLMAFPGGVTKSLNLWYELQVKTVEWLVESGRLNQSDCPLTNSRGTYLVHTSPHRKNGNSFTEPKRVVKFWIDGSESATGHVRRTTDILKATGIDPATVFVS